MMELPLPANVLEFDALYRDEDSCRRLLVQARWPNGFVCPKCQHAKGWEHKKRPLVECASCGHQASALAGTLFHSAKLPLRKLFRLVYQVVAEKSGTNMCALSRQIGVCYDTAMLWTRKIRNAMVRPTREKLSGKVEVDETTLGGPAEGHPGRSLGENQALVVILVEDVGGARCGRIRLDAVDSGSKEDLLPVVESHVETGSVVRTDGWKGYGGLHEKGYTPEVKKLSGPNCAGSAAEELPLVHRVAALLKRFINGVLQGSWTHRWLPQLLDEFVFRFNRRKSKSRPLLFNRVIESGVLKRAPTRSRFRVYSQVMRGLMPS